MASFVVVCHVPWQHGAREPPRPFHSPAPLIVSVGLCGDGSATEDLRKEISLIALLGMH